MGCCEDCKRKLNVQLEVDGKEIDMHGFVQDMVGSVVLGMVSTLKDVENPKEITIKISEK
jgi:hypothetical protein